MPQKAGTKFVARTSVFEVRGSSLAKAQMPRRTPASVWSARGRPADSKAEVYPLRRIHLRPQNAPRYVLQIPATSSVFQLPLNCTPFHQHGEAKRRSWTRIVQARNGPAAAPMGSSHCRLESPRCHSRYLQNCCQRSSRSPFVEARAMTRVAARGENRTYLRGEILIFSPADEPRRGDLPGAGSFRIANDFDQSRYGSV